ncbi:conserved hypothetical protein [Gammaproteobacteria bacterium]
MTASKKPFNKYSLVEAYAYLHIRQVIPWQISYSPIEPTAIFQAELGRLQAFDVTFSERGKEVLIDTILQEALSRRIKLKVWKEVSLKTDNLSGRSEYIFAPRLTVLTHPFVCLAEAKKDDFEQGTAQCVLGMKACQLLNAKEELITDMHGIVTNAVGWKFHKLTTKDEIYESPLYSFQTQMPTLFGVLDTIFAACEQYIQL